MVRIGEQAEAIDALLTCEEHGIVIFDLPDSRDPAHLAERRDELITALTRSLLSYRPLASRGRLTVEVNAVTILPPDEAQRLTGEENGVAAPANAPEIASTFPSVSSELLIQINAGVQRIGNIKAPNRRRTVSRNRSRGWIMQEIEKATANLDRYQKIAAIETPEGPQRIRGLAGAGKTIVLAHKAAFLHARNPEWRIGVTFHTRSLYQQFRDLIRKFYYEQTDGDEPDWSRLQVLHAWGGSDQAGFYSTVAHAAGSTPHTFSYGRVSIAMSVHSMAYAAN